MDVKEIVEKYLRDNGYDGLVDPGNCSCAIGDLAPCGECCMRCEPGHEVPCTCGEGCDYDMEPGPRLIERKQEKGGG